MPVLTHQSIRSFLDFLRYEKRYSVHTLTSYETDLIDFIDYLETRFGGVALEDVTHTFVRSWLAHLKERGLTAKSINRKISGLKSFFKYHLRTGTISSTPMAKVISPKIGRRLPVFVKEGDTRDLLKALDQSTDSWKSLNTQLLITIFYATGMRLSELINLKEKQVDFSRSQVKVLGKGNKERIIPLGKKVMELIKNYLQLKKKEFASKDFGGEKSGDTLLVTEKGKKLYPKYAYLLVNQVLGEASTLDKKSPHVLRHTFATHLMNNGADLNAVKELLGHSSLASTQVYTHNTIEKLKDVHRKAHPKA